MPFLKLKSKRDSTCQFEDNGMKCSNSYKTGDEYIFDTEHTKGYCLSHESINSKVSTPQAKSGGNWKGGGAPLCRTPSEAMEAITLWHETVIKMIEETAKKFSTTDGIPDGLMMEITRTYEEIFLGKFTPSKIAA